MLFAHDTGNALVIGKASILIDEGEADANLLLFRKGEPLNGASGAYLAAEGAGVFAVSNLGDENRTPDPLPSSLEQGRLETVGGADLHALATSNAALKEFPLRHGPRRTNETRGRKGSKGTRSEQGNRESAANSGSKQHPSLQVHSEGRPILPQDLKVGRSLRT